MKLDISGKCTKNANFGVQYKIKVDQNWIPQEHLFGPKLFHLCQDFFQIFSMLFYAYPIPDGFLEIAILIFSQLSFMTTYLLYRKDKQWQIGGPNRVWALFLGSVPASIFDFVRDFVCHQPFLAATAAQEAHLSVRTYVRMYVTKLQVCTITTLQHCNISTLQHYNIAT